MRAAEKSPDGLLGDLPDDVVTGDVDPAHRLNRRAAPAEVDAAAEELVPEALDVERVFAHGDGSQAVHHVEAGGGSVDDGFGDERLRLDVRPADDTGVGINPNQAALEHAGRLLVAD